MMSDGGIESGADAGRIEVLFRQLVRAGVAARHRCINGSLVLERSEIGRILRNAQF